ncbi:MAG: regulatory iron-sulfur-containing complex subunit RicT [Treponema sp.]|nr:regulatory iron-sulfur-containing complex subunit RicT [Treponema sp.]
MSDIFESDIDDEGVNLQSLEDNSQYEESENLVVDYPLFHLKLEYSSETLYAKVPDKLTINPGDYVITPTRYGKDMALVLGESKKPVGIKQSDIVTIDRKANENDLKKREELKQKEKDAFPVFREKVANHKLDMKLVEVHFLFDEQKALFFFSSDNRVDFRELVKDLVSIFKMRIELRQIGVRDESRITGGLGVCGRPFCCHGVSDKLKPVSIKMAKDQNLSLNSMKISGQCGRLLCCLSYECDWYCEARKSLPTEGLRIFYDGTDFRITEVNPLTSMVKMSGEDGRLLEVNAKRFYKDNNNHWKIN